MIIIESFWVLISLRIILILKKYNKTNATIIACFANVFWIITKKKGVDSKRME
jgi:hypothetical protein